VQQREEVSVPWSWPELVAVREAIELTPEFNGRDEVRAALGARSPATQHRDVTLDLELAERLAANLLALDLQTVVAKSKLLRALREAERS
jgi:hypothetical protein